MLCKCGTKCPEGTVFCSNCGSKFEPPVQQPIQPDQPEPPLTPSLPPEPAVAMPQQNQPPASSSNSLNPKLIAIIGGALAVIIIAVLAFVFLGGGSGGQFDMQRGGFTSFFRLEDGWGGDVETFITDSRGNAFNVNSWLNRSATSLDATRFAYLTDEGDLYFIHNGNRQRVARDVSNFVMSLDGSAVVYVTDTDDDDLGTLVLWQARNGSTRVVETSVVHYQISISPDGRTVGFAVLDRNDDVEGFFSVNGRTAESLGRNRIPMVISNSGRFVYYFNESNQQFRVSHRGDSVRLADSDNLFGLWFNRDLTEVMFVADGTTFISERGRERQRISNNHLVPALPEFIQTSGMNVFGVRSFRNIIAESRSDSNMWGWSSTYDLVYIDGSFETNRIARNVIQHEVSRDGGTVVYLNSQGRLTKLTNVSRTEPTTFEFSTRDEIEEFVMTADGSQIYFINDFNDLYFIRGTNSPTRVRQDVYTIVMSPNSDTLFFIADIDRNGIGELFTTRRGATATRVDGAREVSFIRTTATCVFYFSTESGHTGDVFRSNGNARFTRILEDVRWW